MISCPNCHENVSEMSNICPHCQMDISRYRMYSTYLQQLYHYYQRQMMMVRILQQQIMYYRNVCDQLTISTTSSGNYQQSMSYYPQSGAGGVDPGPTMNYGQGPTGYGHMYTGQGSYGPGSSMVPPGSVSGSGYPQHMGYSVMGVASQGQTPAQDPARAGQQNGHRSQRQQPYGSPEQPALPPGQQQEDKKPDDPKNVPYAHHRPLEDNTEPLPVLDPEEPQGPPAKENEYDDSIAWDEQTADDPSPPPSMPPELIETEPVSNEDLFNIPEYDLNDQNPTSEPDSWQANTASADPEPELEQDLASSIINIVCYNCAGTIEMTDTGERPLILVCPQCGSKGQID